MLRIGSRLFSRNVRSRHALVASAQQKMVRRPLVKILSKHLSLGLWNFGRLVINLIVSLTRNWC